MTVISNQSFGEILPTAKYRGELLIGDTKLSCVVLNDKRRILPATAVFSAFGRPRRGPRDRDPKINTKKGRIQLPAFIGGNNLKPFIEKDLERWIHPVVYMDGDNKIEGYAAEILPELCEMYLKARRENALTKDQEKFAIQSEILYGAFAKVGIVALVDEATGFQYERSRSALEKVLEKFIQEELGQWAKRFPDRFYTELFRLKNLDWPSNKNPPQYVGHWTNNLVYKRLAPGVLEELKRKSPKDAKGNRKNHLHQWLTDDIGHPKLREHIAALLALMKSSDTWEDFEPRLERALPKRDKEPTEEEAAQICLIEV